MPLQPHQSIDHYEILALLGAGGMGEVYRARDTRLNRDVAIKVLPGFSTADADRLRRFEQEARAAAALNHPNILAVYQMGMHQGAPYLVSELLEGETLRERLKRGAMPLRKVIEIGSQIARGLAAAHEKGIIHRDLKPENLFLTKDGQAKILDFGLARLTQPKESDLSQPSHEVKTVEGMLLGSVGYMSPEQVRGQVADHRSDIFTFASVLYEMVTGKRAFQGSSSVEAMSAVLNEEPRPIAETVPNAPVVLQRVLHRGLEKNPEQRFQSASDLGFALQELADSGQSTYTTPHRIDGRKPTWSRSTLTVVSISILVLIGIGAYLWMRPIPDPQVANYVQLSHDGLQKNLIGTDGSRLFLTVVNSGVQDSAALQITGGEATRIPMPRAGMVPLDLSPDGSSLLVVDGNGYPAIGPLWSLAIMGDSPRRLGDATGQVGTWSEDGKQLAYANGMDVFLAKADGSEPRKLTTMKSMVSGLSWSPDASHLRVETEEITQSGTSVVVGERTIWDVSQEDGSSPRPLFQNWQNAANACCGNWTTDGKYFVFQAQGQIWALPKDRRRFQQKAEPVQLTSSPMSLQSPLPSKDGKKLFVVGRTYRGELTEFNVKTQQPALFLNGISADWIDTSRDGSQIAYVSYPQGDLWKSTVDGSERVQLTFGTMKPVLPRWSPDGHTILFFDFPGGPNRPGKMYQVPASGGTPHQLMPDDKQNEQDPTWSPDGRKIAYAGDANDAATSTGPAIKILDLETKQTTPLPGSKGFFSPRWSPDGRFIAAMTSDASKLMLFDFQTQKWTEIGKGTLSWLNWSRDSQYVYCKDLSGKGSVERIHVADGKAERLVDLKDFVLTGLGGGSVSVGPDGSPLLLRDRGTQDIYALDWIEP